MDSLNRLALELVDEAIEFADALNVGVFELDCGATVLDFGVENAGGIEAGLLLSEIQTAGLATVDSRLGEVAGAPIPAVELTTDHPAVALLCSQKAGWEVSVDGYEALGSGPARALVGEEEEFVQLGYHDAFEFAVLALETGDLPTDAVAEHVADLAEVEPGSVFLPTVPTASVAGSVCVAGRAAELAMFRLFELGYDPLDVLSATASAPVAPVAANEEAAIGRTNDALAYGGRVHLIVREESDVFADLPSTAADEYGRPFAEVFADADWTFSEVPETVFAPAQVSVDVVGGSTTVHGERNERLLEASFEL